MKYCGIELKGDEARVIGVETKGESYSVITSGVDKFKIKDPSSQQDMQAFAAAFQKFLTAGHFDAIGIKGRMTKGRFAGGSTSFKMEGIIQCMPFSVSIINPATIRSKLKDTELDLAGCKEYQIEALKVVLTMMAMPAV
ncbi:MAG: DUF3010 family protein [Saprospiraceae bacterium]|nr:DUF3010 family protein [Candidatus Opimibacter skivensis]